MSLPDDIRTSQDTLSFSDLNLEVACDLTRAENLRTKDGVEPVSGDFVFSIYDTGYGSWRGEVKSWKENTEPRLRYYEDLNGRGHCVFEDEYTYIEIINDHHFNYFGSGLVGDAFLSANRNVAVNGVSVILTPEHWLYPKLGADGFGELVASREIPTGVVPGSTAILIGALDSAVDNAYYQLDVPSPPEDDALPAEPWVEVLERILAGTQDETSVVVLGREVGSTISYFYATDSPLSKEDMMSLSRWLRGPAVPEMVSTDSEYRVAVGALQKARKGAAAYLAHGNVSLVLKDDHNQFDEIDPDNDPMLASSFGLNGTSPRSPVSLSDNTFIMNRPFIKHHIEPFKEETTQLGEAFLFDYPAAVIHDQWITPDSKDVLNYLGESVHQKYLHREAVSAYYRQDLYYVIYGRGLTVVPPVPSAQDLVDELDEPFELAFLEAINAWALKYVDGELPEFTAISDAIAFWNKQLAFVVHGFPVGDEDASRGLSLVDLVHTNKTGTFQVAYKGGDAFSLGTTTQDFWQEFLKYYIAPYEFAYGTIDELPAPPKPVKEEVVIRSGVLPRVHEEEDAYFLTTDHEVYRVLKEGNVITLLSSTYGYESEGESDHQGNLPIGVIEHSAIEGGYVHLVINQTFPQTSPDKKYVYVILDKGCKNILYHLHAKEPIAGLYSVPESNTEDTIHPGLTRGGVSLHD